MQERFRPFELAPPEGLGGKIMFQLRLFLDFQTRTIFNDLKRELPLIKGKVLDIGCGQSPYKHLLNPAVTEYFGLDIDTASHFGYGKTNMFHFDGQHIPFPDGSIDYIVCTEVLEHVKDPKQLVNEAYRVLRTNGRGIITIPWSARMHYFPYDYHRFTSFALEDLFREFSCRIIPRGGDITVIVSKIMIVYFRNSKMSNNVIWRPFQILFLLLFSPFIVLVILFGHFSLVFHWGSPDDPLGWTIFLQKSAK